jgi:hypothetical protein
VSHPLFIQGLIDTVVCGDAVEKLSELPDKSVDAVITDPPWFRFNRADPDYDPELLRHFDLWVRACEQICRITDRLVVILDCDTDPCFLNPITLPFFRIIWLRRIPPIRGHLFLCGAAIAYVYGHRRLNGLDRVIAGEIDGGIRPPGDSPAAPFQNLNHRKKLIEYLTQPQDFVVDPFCGDGTTLYAAKLLVRRYYGVEDCICRVADAVEVLDTIVLGRMLTKM